MKKINNGTRKQNKKAEKKRKIFISWFKKNSQSIKERAKEINKTYNLYFPEGKNIENVFKEILLENDYKYWLTFDFDSFLIRAKNIYNNSKKILS
jgi:hypothetical protein